MRGKGLVPIYTVGDFKRLTICFVFDCNLIVFLFQKMIASIF